LKAGALFTEKYVTTKKISHLAGGMNALEKIK